MCKKFICNTTVFIKILQQNVDIMKAEKEVDVSGEEDPIDIKTHEVYIKSEPEVSRLRFCVQVCSCVCFQNTCRYSYDIPFRD